jgi:hypothetical protein
MQTSTPDEFQSPDISDNLSPPLIPWELLPTRCKYLRFGAERIKYVLLQTECQDRFGCPTSSAAATIPPEVCVRHATHIRASEELVMQYMTTSSEPIVRLQSERG